MTTRVTRLATEIFANPVAPVTSLSIPDVLVTLAPPNWSQLGISIETAWRTQILDGFLSSAEERTGTWRRPARVMEVRFTGMDREQVQRIMMRLARFAMGRQPVPIYCDSSKTTGSSSLKAIPCDTTLRRFAIGARVLIHAWSGPYDIGTHELGVVADFTPDGIVLEDDLANTYPAGSFVYPVMDAEAVTDSEADWISGDVGEASVTFAEIPGASALPPSATTYPDGAQLTWDGTPIIDVFHEWGDGVVVSVSRDGSLVDVGRGTVEDLGGDRPRLIHDIDSVALSRAEAWRVLQWFDSCMGRLDAVVLVSPITMFTALDVGARTIDVASNGNSADVIVAMDRIAIVETDGTIHVRRIASIAEPDPDTWQVIIHAADPDIAVAIEDVARTTSAHLVRFGDDALDQTWRTQSIVLSDFRLVDLLNEGEYPVPNVSEWEDTAKTEATDQSPSSIPDVDEGLYLWVDASTNTWLGDSDESATPTKRLEASVADGLTNSRVDFWDDIRYPGQLILGSGGGFPAPFLRSNWHGVGTQGDEGGFLRSFKLWAKNKGRDIVELAGAGGSHFKLIEAVGAEKFWSNDDGLTFMWIGRLKSTENHRFIEVDGPNGTAFRFRQDRVEFYSTLGVVDSGIWLDPIDDLRSKASRIIALRWIPSTQVRVWRDGTTMGVKTIGVSASIDTADTGDLTKVLDFDGEVDGPGDIDNIGKNTFTSAMAIWRRALTNSEINLVGNFWANLYKAKWKDLP